MDFKIIGSQTFLNIKRVLLNKVNILLIFFVAFAPILISIILIPLVFSYSMLISLLTVTICSTSFIDTNIKWNKFNTSEQVSKNEINISSILTMIIICFTSYILIFSILVILNQFNLLLVDWFTYSSNVEGEYKYVFNLQLFIISLYSIVIIIIITYLISLLIIKLFSDFKSYSMVMFSILVLVFLFGGTLNSYWWPTGDSSVFGEYEGGLYRMRNSLYPWNMYWISMFFPYFSTGSTLNIAMSLSRSILVVVDGNVVADIFNNGSTTFFDINPVTNIPYHNSMFEIFGFNNDPLWVLLLWTPYIEIALLILILFGAAKISE